MSKKDGVLKLLYRCKSNFNRNKIIRYEKKLKSFERKNCCLKRKRDSTKN